MWQNEKHKIQRRGSTSVWIQKTFMQLVHSNLVVEVGYFRPPSQRPSYYCIQYEVYCRLDQMLKALSAKKISECQFRIFSFIHEKASKRKLRRTDRMFTWCVYHSKKYKVLYFDSVGVFRFDAEFLVPLFAWNIIRCCPRIRWWIAREF